MRISLTPDFSSATLATESERRNVSKGLTKMTLNLQISTQPNHQAREQNKDIFRYIKTQFSSMHHKKAYSKMYSRKMRPRQRGIVYMGKREPPQK